MAGLSEALAQLGQFGFDVPANLQAMAVPLLDRSHVPANLQAMAVPLLDRSRSSRDRPQEEHQVVPVPEDSSFRQSNGSSFHLTREISRIMDGEMQDEMYQEARVQLQQEYHARERLLEAQLHHALAHASVQQEHQMAQYVEQQRNQLEGTLEAEAAAVGDRYEVRLAQVSDIQAVVGRKGNQTRCVRSGADFGAAVAHSLLGRRRLGHQCGAPFEIDGLANLDYLEARPHYEPGPLCE